MVEVDKTSALIFCNAYPRGKWDICTHDLCKKARVTSCDENGNYVLAPGRSRVPYSGRVTLRYPLASDGSGRVRVCPSQMTMAADDFKELGFILAIDSEKGELDMFVHDEQGYFRYERIKT